MKTHTLVALVLTIIIGLIVVAVREPAHAQSNSIDPSETVTGRFQIAAIGTDKDGSGSAYYVIDSVTGEIWMNYGDAKPSKVSGPLR